MSTNGIGERSHGLADFVVWFAAICLSLASWACFAGQAAFPVWKPWLGTMPGVLLALASLTRHPHWSQRLKLAAGGWVLAAPFALGFFDLAPALWSYLAIGAAMLAAAVPASAPAPRRPAAGCGAAPVADQREGTCEVA